MGVTVFGTRSSGNCHKVRMVLDITGREYTWHEIDLMKAETRTPEFLELNRNGKVPVVKLEDGSALAESNAILWYFAEETELMPADRLQRARMLQWMFFEQYTHEPSIAVARFILQFLKVPDHERLPALQQRGYEALAVMEHHLETRPFFVGQRLSLADLALFAYTHRAAEGGFDLAPYPAVRRWLDRCRAESGVSEMPAP
jgi:glutathione S-transferase